MRLITTSFISSFAVLLVSFLIGLFGLSGIDGLLVLQLDQYRNVILGSQKDVFLIILFGGVLSLVNLSLVGVLKKREHFVATLLAIGSVFTSLLILISVFVIIANN